MSKQKMSYFTKEAGHERIKKLLKKNDAWKTEPVDSNFRPGNNQITIEIKVFAKSRTMRSAPRGSERKPKTGRERGFFSLREVFLFSCSGPSVISAAHSSPVLSLSQNKRSLSYIYRLFFTSDAADRAAPFSSRLCLEFFSRCSDLQLTISLLCVCVCMIVLFVVQ